MHPLYAKQHIKEFKGFVRNLSRTSYLGEIGLDLPKEGISTKKIQLVEYFGHTIPPIQDNTKPLIPE